METKQLELDFGINFQGAFKDKRLEKRGYKC